jgi:hypothetical protein
MMNLKGFGRNSRSLAEVEHLDVPGRNKNDRNPKSGKLVSWPRRFEPGTPLTQV